MLHAVKWLNSCLFICLTLSFLDVHGQTGAVIIKGKVGDAVSHAILPDASLALVHLPDSIVIRRSLSGNSGFLFNRLKPGNYQLYISNIGYRDTAVGITLKTGDSVLNTDTIWLQPNARSLVEVVVKAIIPPVISKSDTLIYDAGAFTTRPNATVEELLKKLPGIQVDREGNVTIQGEKVQKVFIDGKTFFLNDPRLATQNLLADMVDKVEAFNEKSERAKLTGIPDVNPAKVINLRLKPDKKKGLFGNGEAGLASKNRYGIKATASYFKGDSYLSGAGSSSNGGNLQGGGGILNNKMNNISLDYRNTFSEKWQVTAGYSGIGNNSKTIVHSQRQTFLPDSSLLQDREMTSATKQNYHRINALLQYAIDSFSRIRGYASLSMSDNGNSNTDQTTSEMAKTGIRRQVNDAFTNYKRTGSGWNGTFSLNYNHRFKKTGRYLGVDLNKGNAQSNSQGVLQSLTHFYNENGQVTDSLARVQQSPQTRSEQNYGFNITYTEPLATGQVLDFSFSLANSGSQAKQETFNYNILTGKYDERDSIASNSFETRNANQQIAAGYNYFRKKMQWQAGLALSRNNQFNRDLSGHQPDLKQTVTNIFPRASMIYSISKQKNLQISYNGSNRPPTILELQPLPDYSNPLLIRLGNPALKQEFTNEIKLNYKDFNARNNRNLFGEIQFNNTSHKIVNATRINAQGAQEQQYVNLQGNYAIGANIDYSISFGKLSNKANVGFSTNVRYDNAVSLINAERNVRKTFYWGPAVRLEYNLKENFTASASAGFNGSWAAYSTDAGNATTLFSHFYNTSILYELPWKCVVTSAINFVINEAQQHLPGTQAAVWNASIVKRLFKNQAGEIKLAAFDLLNKSNNFAQDNGDNYIQTTTREVLKSVFVLSFRYNFRINRL